MGIDNIVVLGKKIEKQMDAIGKLGVKLDGHAEQSCNVAAAYVWKARELLQRAMDELEQA